MLRVFVADAADDREALYQLRYEVFTQEQSKYRAIADHAGRRLKDALDDVAVHVAVADGDRIVGGLRQVRGLANATPTMVAHLGLDHFGDLPKVAFGFSGRLCIDPEYRGSRALLNLLELNYRTAREQGTFLDFIFCNPHIIHQYEQLGYRRYFKAYEDRQLGLQAPMVLVGDDLAHLGSVRSPFLPFARDYPPAGHQVVLAERFEAVPTPLSAATYGCEAYRNHVERALAACGFGGFLDWKPAAAVRLLLEPSSLIGLDVAQSPTLLGTPAKELFVVLSGRLAAVDGSGRTLDAFAGSVVGHADLFDRSPHRLEFRALEPSELLVIDELSLSRLERHFPNEYEQLRERLGQGFVADLRGAASLVAT